ncbi:nuclear transport factor 2 family protein [Dyadobacter luticola]|uniref:Nuclear transport factor 2 family protein n=1 Tax=Dyadobacter luticola TaxID=1979387 RepID=A0A5R9KUZ9_9BACT|nr:nuclear transport factor 2 family protein [Dyadobacter luticola]TLU99969.1 nuclear transport factor 2 family protein [Dyadobacter luticola]
MKFILSCFLFFAFVAFSFGQNNIAQPLDGTDCSNLFFRALLEEDVNNVTNLISNDFTMAGFQGQTIDAQFLQQAISQGHINIESGILTGTNTRNYGDVAIVTGKWDVAAKIENSSYQGELSYMTVCVRSGGKWKVVAVQLSPNR